MELLDKYVAEHKSGEGGHLYFALIKLTQNVYDIHSDNGLNKNPVLDEYILHYMFQQWR